MSESNQWIRDYYNAYYLSAAVEHINMRRLVRRTKSSVFNKQAKPKSKQERHTCTFNEIQKEIANVRKMLSNRLENESCSVESLQKPNRRTQTSLY
jgi:hypothetical protein